MGMIMVVNLHGLINVPGDAREALIQLGIGRRFAATFVPDEPSTLGTLRRCKDYVAWSPADVELVAALLKARGKVSNSRPLDESALKALGFRDHAELASKMVNDGSRLAAEGVKPFVGLSPPRGGFKRSSRRQFREGGILGENPELPQLVRRML